MGTVCVDVLFGLQVKHVGLFLHRLRASGEVELIESDRTVQRVGDVLHHLQVPLVLRLPFSESFCLFRAGCTGTASLESEVVDFAGSAAGFRVAGEVGKRQALVLLHGVEVEVFGAEEEQRVEQHYG